jgi:glucose-1-phosphate cytidylyltransferase
MQVVILCGGKGTRLSEKTELIPKPLVEVGGKPILWHIMKIYASYGHKDFILCLGYKSHLIEEYFKYNAEEDWSVKCFDTGLEATKSERILKIKDHVTDDNFLLAYGDDVTDADINKVIEFHKDKQAIVTITSVNPESGYGIINVNDDDFIVSFKEKPKLPFWINGGYMVCKKEVFGLLDKGELENEVFEYLASKLKIRAYKHDGFWKSMNTLKENNELNELWKKGNPPWKVWSDES